jgi:flagellar biosynthesis/type III secretory pathway ATPase
MAAGPYGRRFVGLSGTKVQLMPYDEMEGIEVGCVVIATGNSSWCP